MSVGLMSLLGFQSIVTAAATYRYSNNGENITVSYEGANYRFIKSAAQSGGRDNFSGVVRVTISGNECDLGVQLLVTPGETDGVVSAPAFLNGIPSVGSVGSSSVPSCTRDAAANFDEFNKSVTISGSVNDSTPAPTPSETAGQREVIVTVYSPVPVSELSGSTIISRTFIEGGGSPSQRTVSWGENNSVGSVRWSNASPGDTYRFCITPTNVFDTQACKIATKVAGTPLLVDFGSFETSFNEDGDKVNVTVNINVPAAIGARTYGPVSLTLFGAATSLSVGETSTGANTVGEPGSNTPAQSIQTYGIFEEIEAGTYKVCLSGSDTLCSAEFTKAVNTSASTTIDIPENLSDGLLSQETGSTCNIDGIGWIICPALTFMASLTDNAFRLIEDFLIVDPGLLGTSSGTFTFWQAMRDFSNVAFIIVFLIIIFSQLTSVGVSNYGVKKTLPRLVISAILVNISFFICQLAVDLSNVIGASLYSALMSIPVSPVGVDASGDPIGWVIVIAGIIAAGGAAALAISVPVLLAALVAVGVILLILMGRFALIVILTGLAPLAFVAFLLPNTENLFKKWLKLFTSMLVLYPIVAVVFGASYVASRVIANAGGEIGSDFLQITSLAVAAIPLLVVPSILKGALDSAGSLGTKISGLGSKAFGNIGKQIKTTSKLGAYNEARKRNAQIRRAQITGGVYKGKNPFTRASSAMNARLNSSRITGSIGNRVAQQAAQIANKLDIENIEASKAQIEQAVISNADLAKVANGEAVKGLNGKDATMRAAALETLAIRGQYTDLARSWDTLMASDDSAAKRATATAFSRSSAKPVFMGASALQNVALGETSGPDMTFAGIADAGTSAGAYSPVKVATAPKDELEYVFNTVYGGNPASVPTVLRQAAKEASDNPEISQNISKNRQVIDDIKL